MRNQPDARSVPETRSERNNSEISSRKADVSKRQRARPHACRPASTTVPQFNYSQTPNALMDVWMPLLRASEFTVLMCVVRFTFGFHRDEVAMGMRLLAQRTGLHPETVSLAVRSLERRGVIACTVGSSGRLTYAVQPDAKPSSSGDCTENQNSDCTDFPHADCTDFPNTRKKSSSKERFERKPSPAHSGRDQQPEAIPEAPKIPPQPEPRTTSTPVFFKADDDERRQGATAKREPIPEPREEFRARVAERHSFDDAQPEYALQTVCLELLKRNLTLDQRFLDFEARLTTNPAGLRNPIGHYRRAVSKFSAEITVAAITERQELNARMNAFLRPPEEKPKGPKCDHCHSEAGRGVCFSDDKTGFVPCPVCATPEYSEEFWEKENRRRETDSARRLKAKSAAA
jgi:hypothetical protein